MSSLNIVVSKKDLDSIVGKAGLAALTEEGQSEISRASNETRGCIRISALDGEITCESSVSRFSARYVIKAGENDSEIISEGETCVPAKELKTIAGKIKDGRKVSIVFSDIQLDSSINVSPAARSVLPDGVVEVGVINGNKVVSKTKIEAYPARYFSGPQYPEISDLTNELGTIIMRGNVANLKVPCNTVGFSIYPQDPKEIFNKFAIFTSSENMYVLGSDGRRAAIVQSSATNFDHLSDCKLETPILIDAEFVSPALASLGDDAPLTLGLDDQQERAYLCSGQTIYCINMIDKALRVKYPSYKRIFDLETMVEVLINRDELSETIGLLSIVNSDRGRYLFSNDEVVKLTAQGIGAVKEAKGSVSFKYSSNAKMTQDPISLNTKYLIEGIKRMKSENIRMAFTEDGMRVKISDESDANFVYFMQVMNSDEA